MTLETRAAGSADSRRVPAAELQAWARSALQACDLGAQDAALVADCLVQTSLWGIDTHGIARLPHYLSRLQAGSIEARPKLALEQTGPATASLDGGHGLGMVVCTRAMDEAIRLARSAGVGVVGCRHSSHCGAIGLYGRQATRAGLIGITFTHADSVVVPHAGRRAFLGTNPICIAVPSAEGEAVCVDMATTPIPFNRVIDARRDRAPLPPGFAVDAAGQATTEPDAAVALLPLGGLDKGYKGYALAFLIDVLCGPLNAMPFGPHIPAMYGDLTARRNLGSLLIALDPARFAGGADLAERVAAMAREARAQPPAEPSGEVLVPGDPEYRTERVRGAAGIPVDDALAAEMRSWSQRLRVAPPGALAAPG